MIDLIGAAHPNYEGTRMSERVIIGVSGYARSGKDSVADVLVQDFGFARFSFADKLREFVYALNPIVVDEQGGSVRDLQEVIDKYTWFGYKETPWGVEIRRILQRAGTDAGRKILGNDIWVKYLDDVQGDVVVPDCRFINEYDRVKVNGGQMWRVSRPGVVAINGHESETALDDQIFDWEIENDGTLEDLREKVNQLMENTRRN